MISRTCGNPVLKTYAANFYAHHSRVRKLVKLSGSCLLTTFYAHHSRVRKRVKVSGSCLSTFYGFRSTQF